MRKECELRPHAIEWLVVVTSAALPANCGAWSLIKKLWNSKWMNIKNTKFQYIPRRAIEYPVVHTLSLKPERLLLTGHSNSQLSKLQLTQDFTFMPHFLLGFSLSLLRTTIECGGKREEKKRNNQSRKAKKKNHYSTRLNSLRIRPTIMEEEWSEAMRNGWWEPFTYIFGFGKKKASKAKLEWKNEMRHVHVAVACVVGVAWSLCFMLSHWSFVDIETGRAERSE